MPIKQVLSVVSRESSSQLLTISDTIGWMPKKKNSSAICDPHRQFSAVMRSGRLAATS
ncbi:MAG: hypothetical protein ACTS73_09515 [Arsenophonus sp. NEOnobi-MAG3]